MTGSYVSNVREERKLTCGVSTKGVGFAFGSCNYRFHWTVKSVFFFLIFTDMILLTLINNS